MLIAGLGNPGKEYEGTRHNVGFWAADAIAAKFHVSLDKKLHQALVGDLVFRNTQHLLVKPMTYMNLSGESISALMIDNELPPENLLVIVDDINLPVGRIRLRASGSDGGHNGLRSVISHIGKNFWRLRIGVGQPINDESDDHSQLVSHVLGSISNDEQKIFNSILEEIPDLTALWLMDMGFQAMTKFNCRFFSA